MPFSHEVFIIGGTAVAVVFFVLGTAGLVLYAIILPVDPEEIIHAIDENSDDETIENSTSLVTQAKNRVEMFDDGDNKEKSVYNDRGFVNAVKKKVRGGNFRVKCFFNESEVSGLLFVQEMGKLQENLTKNVEIWTRREADRPSDTHYKIIDNGRRGRLASHDLGSVDRDYQDIDCRSLGVLQRFYFNQVHLRPFRQNKKNFKRFELRGEAVSA